MDSLSQGIPEFYSGRTLLVTGATGFMGKVLLEKLLRCCPDVRRVYILIRPKRGVEPEARVEAMAKKQVFARLLEKQPDVLSKVVPLEGNVNNDNLGLSLEDQQTVVNEVSVVFHMAASLNFKAPLKDAVEHNTRGTKRILDFCLKIKDLKSFVYVSTAFCHCEEEVLEERVYKPRVDPHYIMKLCDELDDKALEELTPKMLGKHPNTYTFTKQLAEAVVAEYHTRMPISIARPSIVIAALREPTPGWVDSINGPTGLIIASAKGVLRSMMCQAQNHLELIPVDVAINALLALAFKRTLLTPDEARSCPVYNISSNRLERLTYQEVVDRGRILIQQYPFEWTMWYPDGSIRTNWLSHTLIVFFFQTVPAYFFDFLLLLAGQRRFVVQLQSRIGAGLRVLQYFTMREWDFRNEQAMALWTAMNDRDKEIFYMNNVSPVDRQQYMKDFVLGARVYCCNEPLSSIPRCRRNLKVLFVVHHTCVYLFYVLCAWLVYRVLQRFYSPAPYAAILDVVNRSL